MPTSGFGRRHVGEPWHTVLYKDPARFWWLPGLLAGLVCAAVPALLNEDLRRRHVVTGLVVSVVAVALAFVSYRRDSR